MLDDDGRFLQWLSLRRTFDFEMIHLLPLFYVANLPDNARKSDLWGLRAKLGKLADIYIAGRKDVSDVFFAFIGF